MKRQQSKSKYSRETDMGISTACFRKARAGELENNSGLEALARLTEIDVDQVGVNGAKNFFEAKIEELSKTNKFHDEIIQEQEEKRREAEEKAARRQRFKEKAALFQH